MLLAAIAAVVLLSVVGAPLDVPRNDAWSYSRTAEVLQDTGDYELLRYGRMTLVGHILWAQPFLRVVDDREVAGNSAGIVATTVAVLGAYLLARRLVAPLTALAASGLLLVFPGVANTVATFMTEPTALALTSLSLLAGLAALRADGARARWLLTLAAVLGVAGYSVREFGLAVAGAVLLAALVLRPKLRGLAVPLGAAVLAASGALSVWQSRLPYLEPSELYRNWSLGVPQTAQGLVTLGLGLLPFTLLPGLRLLVQRRPHALLGAAVGLGLIVVCLVAPRLGSGFTGKVIADDMLTRTGVSAQSLAVGVRPVLLPDGAWWLLNVLAGMGAVLLGVVVAEYVRRRATRGPDRLDSDPWLLLEAMVVLHLALVSFFGLFGPLFNERYVWPVVVPLALLVSRVRVQPPSRRAALLPALPAAVLVLAALTLTQDAGAYDGALWAAGERAVARGADPGDVDAGLEWVGAHSTGPRSLAPTTVDPLHPYYQGFYPRRRCWVVSNQVLPGSYEVVERRSYRSRLGLVRRPLYLQRNASC